MKILLAIFALIVVCQAGIPGGYNEQDLSFLSNNPQAQSCLQFGETQFLQKAFAKGEISSPNLKGKVLKLETQVVSGVNYRFLVEFNDTDGKPIYATFVVYSQPWTKTQEFVSYSIQDTPQF